MKHIFVNAMGIISIILLCCTLICGAWVGTHPIDDMAFHAIFSAASVVIAIIVQIINLCKCRHCRKHQAK